MRESIVGRVGSPAGNTSGSESGLRSRSAVYMTNSRKTVIPMLLNTEFD